MPLGRFVLFTLLFRPQKKDKKKNPALIILTSACRRQLHYETVRGITSKQRLTRQQLGLLICTRLHISFRRHRRHRRHWTHYRDEQMSSGRPVASRNACIYIPATLFCTVQCVLLDVLSRNWVTVGGCLTSCWLLLSNLWPLMSMWHFFVAQRMFSLFGTFHSHARSVSQSSPFCQSRHVGHVISWLANEKRNTAPNCSRRVNVNGHFFIIIFSKSKPIVLMKVIS